MRTFIAYLEAYRPISFCFSNSRCHKSDTGLRATTPSASAEAIVQVSQTTTNSFASYIGRQNKETIKNKTCVTPLHSPSTTRYPTAPRIASSFLVHHKTSPSLQVKEKRQETILQDERMKTHQQINKEKLRHGTILFAQIDHLFFTSPVVLPLHHDVELSCSSPRRWNNSGNHPHMTEVYPRVKKEMLFGPHGRNDLLVLQKKCYLGYIAGMFHWCCEKKTLFPTHGRGVIYWFQSSQYILHMVDI